MAAAFVGGCGTTSEPAASSPAGSPAAPGQAAGAARPRDAYVLLSGGGTPLSNNYSQYLQARALGDFLGREFPPESTWVFFGVGTRDGAVPVLADVRREVKRDGFVVQSWVPGLLAKNRPATRESFLRALREEVLPTVRGGGTLYLFVGDHGELAGAKEKRESAITLWQLKPGRRRSGSWTTDEREILGVAELREVLAAGLGQGRVVFCMTQCHSGGFHELGVAREMVPPRSWFSTVPSWVPRSAPGLKLRVAGYTATDEASPAAGCDANPDPERWLGYERFMPEQLLGLDLMSGQAKGPGVRSLAEAHEAATLIDQTIDKPRSTSEHYLAVWARLIETRLATTPTLTEPARRAVGNYFRAVDRGQVNAGDAGLRERQAQFERFTARLIEQLPAAKELLRAGTRQQLDAAIRSPDRRGGAPGGRRSATPELRRIWTEALRPAWKTAVLAGEVGGLPAAALEFEKRLLELEDKGRDFLLPRGNDDSPLLNELYWASGYAEPARLDRAKAEAIALWGAQRRKFIVAWGRQSADARIRAAAAKIGPGPAGMAEPPIPLSRQTAAERVLFYRRVLAAWEFLLAMDAQPALAELRTLIELERTPVRLTIGAAQ